MSEDIVVEQPVETPAPAAPSGDDFQMPEKFTGKSAEEIAKSYTELEKELGKNKTPAEIAEIKQSLTELREAILSKDKPEPTSDDLAAENTKKYLDGLGYVSKEDLAKAQEQGRKDYELSRINADLAKKYDGKDGRPTYNGQEVADYALKNGMNQLPPETVYKLKHEAELRDWDIKQALKGNRAPAVPGVGKGTQLPGEPDYSKMKPSEIEAIARQKALDRINAQQ